MSSGIVFQGVDYGCTNGVAEYLLDFCIREFPNVKVHEEYPHILEFFSDYREGFFSGLMIFLNEDDFKSKSDFGFLSELFSKVFAFAEGESSELTELGKNKVKNDFKRLVLELEKYAST